MSKVHMTVLGFINYKPMHGYEILNIIRSKHMEVWAGIKMPSVYNALQWLENKEYIVGEQQVEGNNPPRKVFQLTTSGKIYYKKLILEYMSNETVGTDYWLAISFTYKAMTLKEFIQIVERKIKYYKDHLILDKECQSRILSEVNNTPLPFIHKHLLKMGTSVHEIEIGLLNDILDEAKQPENASYFLKEGEI